MQVIDSLEKCPMCGSGDFSEILNHESKEGISQRFFSGIVEKVKRERPDGRWLGVGCGRGYVG